MSRYNIKSYSLKKNVGILTLSIQSLYASIKVCKGFRVGCWLSSYVITIYFRQSFNRENVHARGVGKGYNF